MQAEENGFKKKTSNHLEVSKNLAKDRRRFTKMRRKLHSTFNYASTDTADFVETATANK